MLTEKQQRMAYNLALGMNATEAARGAGYADSGGLRTTASRLQNCPRIQQAAFAEREKRLHGPLASKAIACLESVMDDLAAPPAARITAAKFILEAAGHGLENRRLSARHPGEEGKRPSAMSLAELEEMCQNAEAKLRHVQGQVVVEADTEEELE